MEMEHPTEGASFHMALFAMLVGMSSSNVYTGMIGPDSSWLPGSVMSHEIVKAKL